MQYSILANSYWLLVEGIYLHNLLVITVFTERNYFKIYLCIGWGEPACCVSGNVSNKSKLIMSWEITSEQISVEGNSNDVQHHCFAFKCIPFFLFTGTPLIFLVPWAIAKYLHENQE